MEHNEIKNFIAEKVHEGLSLSQIQDLLNEQNVKMTFMDLRLIASEIESTVFEKQEKTEDPSEKKNAPLPEPEADVPTAPEAVAPADGETPALRGKTTVEVSPIMRPGAVASGSVKFGSGATADWFLDQQGRLGLEKANGQPDQQDIQEFQKELQKAFGG